jgi:hypothetical protein
MTGEPADRHGSGAGQAPHEDDPAAGTTAERRKEITEAARPGSTAGGHAEGANPTDERAAMDEERRGGA